MAIFSEDDAMDIDSAAVPTSKEDDLSQYNLDDYDNDAQTNSKSCSHFVTHLVINIKFSSYGPIHQYQGSNILQTQRRRPLHHTKRCMPFSLNLKCYISDTVFKEEDDDEREELEVLPTDNLLVVAKTEDEISQLEIYVYDESQENLYVHHDLMLPNFPLCLEWLDFPPTSSSSFKTTPGPNNSDTPGFGNYIAVGTLD